MLTENEVVMLVLGISVFFLILSDREHIKKIKAWKFLVTSYFILLFGWVLTVAEGFFAGQLLNIIEHASYAASALFMLIWCWKATSKSNQEGAA